MTPWEQEQERQDAKIWLRPQRQFILDPPFYPFFPPEPRVNFNLGFPK